MKMLLYLALFLAALGTTGYLLRSRAADANRFQTFEYATIRWAGRENTHLIRPSGNVEMLGPLLKAQRPDRVDERAFYLNIAMNAVAKEGFELAAIGNEQIVMKRSVGR